MTKPISDMALRGRIGANRRWAAEPDRRAALAPARAGFLKRFEDLVDPDRLLTEAERTRRAASALKAHMAELNRKRTLARRRSAA